MNEIIEDGRSFRYSSSPWKMCVITEHELPYCVDVYNLYDGGTIRYVPETQIKESCVCCCAEVEY